MQRKHTFVKTESMLKSKYHYPAVAVDIIVEKDDKLLMIRRGGETFKYSHALPGGFIEEGERVEDAAVREMKEETNVDVEPIEILGVYSMPHRDPRGHIVTVVFICKMLGGKVKAGDDAAGIEWVHFNDIFRKRLSSDHPLVIENYLKWKKERGTYWSSKVCCG